MNKSSELFIIVGPRKTGTTSISKWINQAAHSQQHTAKESYFLCADRKLSSLKRHIKKQPVYNNTIFLFEPSYFSDERAQKNVKEIIANLDVNVNIIAIRRDAVQRSSSELFHHMARSGLPEDEVYRKYPSIINDSREFDQVLRKWKSICDNVSIFDFSTVERDLKMLLSKYLDLSDELPRENRRRKFKLNKFGRLVHKLYKIIKIFVPSIEKIVKKFKQKIWIGLANDEIDIDLEKLKRKLNE